MNIIKKIDESKLVLELEGRLDTMTAPQLEKELEASLSNTAELVLVPITLCTIASILKHNPGLSFGLTTLALLCGSIPTYFFSISLVQARILLISFTLLSAFCTFISTKNKKGVASYEKNI